MNNKKIRITDKKLDKLIRESIEAALNEIGDTMRGQETLGRLAGRKVNKNDTRGAIDTTTYARKQRYNKFPKHFKEIGDKENSFAKGYEKEVPVTEDVQAAQDANETLSIKKTYRTKKGYKHSVNIELEKDTTDNSLNGGFEFWVEDNEDETYCSGNLTIYPDGTIDYDGCFSLPKAVRKALEENGYKVD